MSWKEWEIQFMEGLKKLPIEERAKIAEYYQEIYGDKLEAGIPEEEIIKEFGDPKTCAEKILAENGEEKTSAQESQVVEQKAVEPLPVKQTIVEIEPKKKENSTVKRVFAIIGFIILTLLSVLAMLSLGAFALTFACCALAGGVYSILSFTYGLGAEGVLANFGTGIALVGVGILLFVLFAWLTKTVGLGCKKKLTSFYERRIKA